MAIALELFFDPITEQSIRDLWIRVAEDGLSRSMLDRQSRPHISIISSDIADIESLARELNSVSHSLSVSFYGLGFFLGIEGVVYLAPVVTTPLLNLHAELFTIYCSHASEPASYEIPGHWVPHCTIASGLLPGNTVPVMNACAMLVHAPINGSIASFGLVDVGTNIITPLWEAPFPPKLDARTSVPGQTQTDP